MKPVFILLLLIEFFQVVQAQDDIMKSLQDSTAKKQFVTSAFKSSRVIMGQSIEMIGAGVLDLRILHRFGPVNQGISQFFGLDQASFRLGFDYGISKNFTIGIGRSTLNKDLDGFLKYRLVQQSTGPGSFPVSIVLVAGTSIQTYKNTDTTKDLTLTARTGY
jgi:hypothetical protein